MSPSLSVAMIVRDEEKWLSGAIESVKEVAAEVCVADTGSTDGTVALAAQLGARVQQIPWTNDFSAARNASLAMCACPWIFVIDADERIDAGGQEVLRALCAGPPDRAYGVLTRNYTNNVEQTECFPVTSGDPAEGFAAWTPSSKIRLFPNNSAIRFEGAVHELVEPSIRRMGLPITFSDLVVHHYGEAKPPAERAAKAAAYLELGRQKAAQDPEDAAAHAELGNQYFELGDYPRAVAAYRESLRLSSGNAVVLSDLGAVLHLLGRSKEAESALRLSLDLNPARAETWRNLGVVLSAREEWAEAVSCLERARNFRPDWPDGHRLLEEARKHLDPAQP